jgi:hypothetical protein
MDEDDAIDLALLEIFWRHKKPEVQPDHGRNKGKRAEPRH